MVVGSRSRDWLDSPRHEAAGLPTTQTTFDVLWPQAMLALGVFLTLAWSVGLIWIFIRAVGLICPSRCDVVHSLRPR
jgi:hypothetical protein